MKWSEIMSTFPHWRKNVSCLSTDFCQMMTPTTTSESIEHKEQYRTHHRLCFIVDFSLVATVLFQWISHEAVKSWRNNIKQNDTIKISLRHSIGVAREKEWAKWDGEKWLRTSSFNANDNDTSIDWSTEEKKVLPLTSNFPFSEIVATTKERIEITEMNERIFVTSIYFLFVLCTHFHTFNFRLSLSRALFFSNSKR